MRRRQVLALLTAAAWTLSSAAAYAATTPEAGTAPHGTATAGYPRGQHPWPRGDEWPAGLQGPFEKLAPEPVSVPSWDGTVLRGALWRPAVPEGVRVPVVLHASPYLGGLDATADDANEGGAVYTDASGGGAAGEPVPHGLRSRPVPVDLLVRAGYAVAMVNVRGTGESGGCFDYYGRAEQQDQPVLVDWLAAQPWSNGRVGMIGQSYDGTTAMQAAVAAPTALKTIVPMDPAIDYFTSGVATPQAAMQPVFSALNEPVNAAAETQPPVNRTGTGQVATATRYLLGDPGSADPSASPAVQRLCPESHLHAARSAQEPFVSQRDAGYYLDRRLTTRLPDVSASVLGVMGLRDATQQNYGFDAVAWELMDRAPKHFVLGQWDHCGTYLIEGWNDLLLRWLDFWLKGLGDPPAELGTVRYQVNTDGDGGTCKRGAFARDPGAWATASGWPAGRAAEVLYAGDGSLAPEPQGSGSAAFHAAPRADVSSAFCDARDDAVAFVSAPAATATVLAGSPVALLDLTGDGGAGIVTVSLFQVTGDPCAGGSVRQLSRGSADLQFHRTQFAAEPFTAGPVRVDLWNVAELLPEGDRLGVVVSGPDPATNGGAVATAHPRLVLGTAGIAGTQISLPVAEGTLGGQHARTPYPPRPDLPQDGRPQAVVTPPSAAGGVPVP